MHNFNQKYKSIIEKPIDISPLLKDEMYLISGDFYGIQKFIFERLSTQKASKVLRAKSAFVQIFTEYLARYICDILKISEKSILSTNAGKFEILSPKQEIDLEEIQRKIDDYFIKNFYGLSGVILSSVACTREDLSQQKYKALRKKIEESLEAKRFRKFNLFEENAPDVLQYRTDINNNTLCKVCNIRKIEKDESCLICNNFRKLGEKLAYKNDENVSSDKLGIHFDDNFNPEICLDKRLKSYILYEEKDGRMSPADFDTLAQYSCDKSETGLKALAILKADVDNMGKFLEKSDVGVTDSFESFDSFSRSMDGFFSIHIPQMMRDKHPHTYTVFGGGDDLFLLGAWDEILALARAIEREFEAFVQSDDLTISFGIAIAKPTTPISYLAEHTEKLLEEAKEIDGDKEVAHPKDAISLFGETVKWEEYRVVFDRLNKLFQGFEVVNSATLYRLLTFCDMSKNISKDIKNTMWKSKLNYLFSRNIDEKYHYILKELNESIEKCPKATKMFLSEFIYKRRD